MTQQPASVPDVAYDDLRSLFVNCTLKRSPEPSNTQGLVDISRNILEAHGVQVNGQRIGANPRARVQALRPLREVVRFEGRDDLGLDTKRIGNLLD